MDGGYPPIRGKFCENNSNKTWSSVSNSSLSKPFALCQFRKFKVPKLCFLPPNIVLGLEKNDSKNYFGSEENFGLEKNLRPKKKLGLKRFWFEKNVGSEKIFGSEEV